MTLLMYELNKFMENAASGLGLGSALPLVIFVVVAGSLILVGLIFISTANARANRRTASLLGEIDAVMARLNEGEHLGKYGTFAWNFEHPEMSFWSDNMYTLCGLIKRRRVPTTDSLLDMIIESDRAEAKRNWDAAKSQEGPFLFQYKVRGLAGEVRVLQVKGKTTFNAARKPYSTEGVIRDISREVEVDRAKSEFVSLASHQLKTPLTTVRWHCEGLLKGNTSPLTLEQARGVKIIEEANLRMIALVNELLNVSRIELNTFSQQPEEIDVRALLESVVEEQRQSSVERKQKLEVTIADVPHIIADKTMARMVFQNLLSNAIKYTPNGGTVTCDLGVGGAKKEGIFFRVSDTGIGIPRSEQGQVFEKMHRASNARTLVSDGTGLGLYVIKTIIEHAGGGISFDSVEGKGTTFYVTLPLDWRGAEKDTPQGGR